MHSIPDSFDPAVVGEVERRLDVVEREEHVRIPWAIESGSRAWGFPSPDSDYDCRFFFVRPLPAYAAPWRPRDVVETELDVVFDVNGWDLIKAVQLGVRGNATVGEWLRSPLVYAGEPAFRDQLGDLLDRVTSPAAVARHYASLTEKQADGLPDGLTNGPADAGPVKLKRILYALRPAAVLHWMGVHGTGAPPMNLAQLLEEAPPTEPVRDAIDTLIALKSQTRELGQGTWPPAIAAFVTEQLARDVPARLDPGPPPDEARRIATSGFLDLVARWGPPGP